MPDRLVIQRNFTKDYEVRKQEIQYQKLKVATLIVCINCFIESNH